MTHCDWKYNVITSKLALYSRSIQAAAEVEKKDLYRGTRTQFVPINIQQFECRITYVQPHARATLNNADRFITTFTRRRWVCAARVGRTGRVVNGACVRACVR